MLAGGCSTTALPAGPDDAATNVEVAVDSGPTASWRVERLTLRDGLAYHEIPGFSVSPDESTIYYSTYMGNPCVAKPGPGYDIFVGTRTADRTYAGKRVDALNTGWRETAPMIARDGSFILFAREDNVDCATKLGSHLWFARMGAAGFEAPTRLDAIGGGTFSPSEATLSPSGDELIYTVYANIDAGVSLGQLQRATGVIGAWTPTGPIGPPIASAYDTVWPFVTADGTWLYFSSSRPGGSGGGLDIWRARRTGPGTYAAPEPLPYPINSPASDVAVRVSDDGKRIYFERGSSIWVATSLDGR